MAKLRLPKLKAKKVNISKLKMPRLRHLNRWTILALLAYLNVLVVFPLFMSKKNGFVKYHARQGFVLFLFTAIGFFSFYLPILPWIYVLFVLFSVIVGLVNVLTSKERPLPLLGRMVA